MAFGKYKAVASHHQTVGTDQLIKEVCENNPISEGVVTAVVWKLAKVINRHLREGDKVRLRDFGLMKLEIESDKGKPELYKDIKFEKDKS